MAVRAGSRVVGRGGANSFPLAMETGSGTLADQGRGARAGKRWGGMPPRGVSRPA